MNLPITQGKAAAKTDINLLSKPDNRRGYLIDMDGVIYRGNKLISGSEYVIQALLEKEIPFPFLTNNSQRGRCDVVLKLANLDLNVETQQIFTCAIPTARFLASQKPADSAYVIGDAGLLTALHDHGTLLTISILIIW